MAMIISRRDVSSAAVGVRGVIGTALPPMSESSSAPSASSCECREKPSPPLSSERMSRTGTPMKRCRCEDKACDDGPAASRPATVVSRCEARMLRSQRLTRQKLSSEVRRMNQPVHLFQPRVRYMTWHMKMGICGSAPMVMRKKESQSVVASLAKLMSSMVAPGIVPDGIPLVMVMFRLR